jgi:D-beta-D-heptose 7-phosphate kinase/D-beta-D-heptose 1-phosphate adenosyltransferase
MKTVAISGGFDPIHKGHVALIQAAAKLGRLVVILNSDSWLYAKKGYAFMQEDERKYIIENIKGVDEVIISKHKGSFYADKKAMSVCRELEELMPDIFANGGDRYHDNIPEYELCERLGIIMVFNVGGEKVQSSSDLIKGASRHVLRKELGWL